MIWSGPVGLREKDRPFWLRCCLLLCDFVFKISQTHLSGCCPLAVLAHQIPSQAQCLLCPVHGWETLQEPLRVLCTLLLCAQYCSGGHVSVLVYFLTGLSEGLHFEKSVIDQRSHTPGRWPLASIQSEVRSQGIVWKSEKCHLQLKDSTFNWNRQGVDPISCRFEPQTCATSDTWLWMSERRFVRIKNNNNSVVKLELSWRKASPLI